MLLLLRGNYGTDFKITTAATRYGAATATGNKAAATTGTDRYRVSS